MRTPTLMWTTLVNLLGPGSGTYEKGAFTQCNFIHMHWTTATARVCVKILEHKEGQIHQQTMSTWEGNLNNLFISSGCYGTEEGAQHSSLRPEGCQRRFIEETLHLVLKTK